MRSIIALLLLVIVVVSANVLHANNPKTIKGSYIVILKDGTEVHERDTHIKELVSRMNELNDEESDVGFTYNIGKNFIGFAAKLSDKLVQEQLAHPRVKYVEADQMMSIDAPDASTTQAGATWGLDRIDQRNLPISGSYTYNSVAGANVDVYVIDTGILTTHTDFGGRAVSVFNAITTEKPVDLNGHGTHCAGTVGGTTYGVAKKCNLKAVKVLSASGSGTNTGVIAGVNYVSNNKHASRRSVASMSLGGGVSTALDNAVTAAIANGIPFVVAAGNENQNACNVSPAKTPNAVTVGATTNTDARASYSNYGTCVDIFAPGSAITSDWIGSNTAISTISGTSMATPHVAGAIAVYLSLHPSATPAQVSAHLSSEATPNKVTNPMTGSPNLLLYSSP